ncbi:MAG: DUF1501 domain-containing protein, partial [Pseudomonadota bacterium]
SANANTNALFTCISATGNSVFLSGNTAIPYQVSTNGAVSVRGVSNRIYRSDAASEALRTLMTGDSSHILEAEYNRVCRRSIGAADVFNEGLETGGLTTSFEAPERNRLAEQLEVVAKTIAARGSLGSERQVFMVSMGGFDVHNNLNNQMAGLLGQLDFAMDRFYQATVDMGVADQVTTFTASDFGRTLASNGDGSDHGWGGHHLVMGGAVNGGRFYGTAPQISLETEDQIGQGRLLPTTSVDQYAATLASWFGVESFEMPGVAPNIGNFNAADLGFLNNGGGAT